jgi:hypothetical protein
VGSSPHERLSLFKEFLTPHSEEISLSQGDMVVLSLAQKSRETTKIQTTSEPSE